MERRSFLGALKRAHNMSVEEAWPWILLSQKEPL